MGATCPGLHFWTKTCSISIFLTQKSSDLASVLQSMINSCASRIQKENYNDPSMKHAMLALATRSERQQTWKLIQNTRICKKKRKKKPNKETKKKQERLHFWLSRTLSTCDTVEGMSMTELSMNKSAASLDIYSLTNLSK